MSAYPNGGDPPVIQQHVARAARAAQDTLPLTGSHITMYVCLAGFLIFLGAVLFALRDDR